MIVGLLQLCCWNFSVKETLYQTSFSRSWILFKKLFEPPLGRLKGNVRTSSVARWKARVRLPIRHNWTSSLTLTVQTLQAEICRREQFLKEVGHFNPPFKVERDVADQPLFGGRKLEGCPLIWYKNIASRFFRLVTNHACDTRTERITTPKTT